MQFNIKVRCACWVREIQITNTGGMHDDDELKLDQNYILTVDVQCHVLLLTLGD